MPTGRLPVLIVDGRMIPESLAIARFAGKIAGKSPWRDRHAGVVVIINSSDIISIIIIIIIDDDGDLYAWHHNAWHHKSLTNFPAGLAGQTHYDQAILDAVGDIITPARDAALSHHFAKEEDKVEFFHFPDKLNSALLAPLIWLSLFNMPGFLPFCPQAAIKKTFQEKTKEALDILQKKHLNNQQGKSFLHFDSVSSLNNYFLGDFFNQIFI